jgi:hypothetical protein
MAGFSAQELSNLAVSLARLEYRPPDSWLDTFAAATAARMHSFEAQVSWVGRGFDCICCWLYLLSIGRGLLDCVCKLDGETGVQQLARGGCEQDGLTASQQPYSPCTKA